jgi:uncharacterized protein YndB with AHSA1/START domain
MLDYSANPFSEVFASVLRIAMSEPIVTHSTIVIERNIPASTEKVYQAFADPDLKRRWFAEGEQHEVEEFVSDLRPGAIEQLRYRFRDDTPFAGLTIRNQDTVLDLVPEQRIVCASRMDFGDTCISLALVTTEFLREGEGTRLIITFQGAFLPGADGPEIREMGWRQLLDQLAALFERDA